MESTALCLAIGFIIMMGVLMLGLLIVGPVSIIYLFITKRTLSWKRAFEDFDKFSTRTNFLVGSACLWFLTIMTLTGCGLYRTFCYLSGGGC